MIIIPIVSDGWSKHVFQKIIAKLSAMNYLACT